MTTTKRQRIHLLCTENSARSQIAEGLRHFAGDRFEVFSGGTRPVGLSANAVTAMAEISISIAGSRSKSVTLLFLAPLHFAFTPSLMSGASDF
jgi:protein-tyrosine-phosphatase